MDIAVELESLLLGKDKSLAILADLQSALRVREESGASSYTKSRAQALRLLAIRMRDLISKSRSPDLTYADRAKTLVVVSDSYLKLAHAFKTDPKMWSLAQSELVPTLTQVSDEESIDTSLIVLESHLETYLISLDSWLEK